MKVFGCLDQDIDWCRRCVGAVGSEGECFFDIFQYGGCFYEFVEEIVVGGGVGEEGVACGDG